MSSRRIVPFLVAGVTGVLSGVYIFKPLLEESNQDLRQQGQAGTGVQPSQSGSVTTPDTSTTTQTVDVAQSPLSSK